MSSLAVVILNYGDPGDTLSLAGRLGREAGVAAIVVVDNFSTTDNVDRLEQGLQDLASDRIHFLPVDANVGYAAGNNVGLRHAFDVLGADYGLVLNPDVEVLGSFNPIIARLRGPDRPFIFTGRVEQHGKTYAVLRYNPWTCKSARVSAGGGGPLYVSGCCFGFSRAIWTAFGGFWEGYFLQYEELDYIYRYRARFGVFPDVLVDDGISIMHREGATTGSAPLQASPSSDYWSARSKLVFYRRFLKRLLPVAIGYNMAKATYSLAKARHNNVASIFRGTADGLRAPR